jgi:hypothetical protein
MKTLALLLLLAAPPRAAAQTAQPETPKSGTVDSSKAHLDAQDPAGALRDAETAVARGGGADAYAARADAKRALGRPVAEAAADYAQAAKLDPRYAAKYEGLLEQARSEANPQTNPKKAGREQGTGINHLALVLALVMLGVLVFAAALALLRGR